METTEKELVEGILYLCSYIWGAIIVFFSTANVESSWEKGKRMDLGDRILHSVFWPVGLIVFSLGKSFEQDDNTEQKENDDEPPRFGGMGI